MAEWLKAADCKSARVPVRWFKSNSAHSLQMMRLGVSSRRIKIQIRLCSSVVEHFIGNEEVMSSILIKGLVRGKTAVEAFWESNRFLNS
jgi:hypothetical protein